MPEALRLMAVLAHPDDESAGMGGTLARYAAEGIETTVVCATRGERGWNGPEAEFPGLQALGAIREAELRRAARILGVKRLEFLDYLDGDLDQADPIEAAAKIVHLIRQVRPQVVVTFPPDGIYGHPDHIAISQFTAAALVRAAESAAGDGGLPPHRVDKFYYVVDRKEVADMYQSLFGDLCMTIDGVKRCFTYWQDWALTSWIDTSDHAETAYRALVCHASQMAGMFGSRPVAGEIRRMLFGTGTFYRAYSMVNGGRTIERDLMTGLRPAG